MQESYSLKSIFTLQHLAMTDTHCHIHSQDYKLDPDQVIEEARAVGVSRLVCVGTSAQDSQLAVNFVQEREECFASVAQHPHEAKLLDEKQQKIINQLAEHKKVIAIGECGLDYYYSHSSKEDQEKSLIWHFELAKQHKLPMLFHIRDAFDDFWRIYDQFPNTLGVVHSFSAGGIELKQTIERGLYVAFNGIMTFTKDQTQLEALKLAPTDRIVLETDAPFLTPTPYRGKINESKYVVEVAKFCANYRGEDYLDFVAQTEQNVSRLLGV
jgi:TatD DNase family protein